MKNFALFVLFAFVLSVSAYSQENFDVGVVNAKATQLVKPEYPAAAKAVNAGGAVNVKVVIDEEGNVISAKAISGHALLKNVSETAAWKSKFTPTKKNGKPVTVEGILVYNFVSGNNSVSSATVLEDFSKFGEVLNGKALSLPAPKYPAAARAVKAEGSVIVEVSVDEAGNITSAEAVSGHPLLKKESENAAFKAKIEPTLIDGKAVKTKGILVYKFIAN